MDDIYGVPAAFSCSPRAGGNSDHAAECFRSGIRQAGGKCRLYFLRHFNIHPCLGCHRCLQDPHGDCFLTDMDQSAPLFQVLLSAPLLFISAPIYFYHLPAQFKAWIDRSQSYYLRREKKDQALLELPQRPAVINLVAGRKQGKKLFDGAMLTLKYFLWTFNFAIQDQFSFRGLDAPEDLQADHDAVESLTIAGTHAWKALHPATRPY
ncbi:MAG TPA: flavodoxin family protein [Desulfonatronum sp.]|nr:flavodoxin family protein [Desulfonatronum sp.]